MPFPIIAFMGLCKICAVVGGAIFCTHQVTKAYEKKQKTQQAKIDANLQISQDKLKSAQETNRKIEEKEKEQTEEIGKTQKVLEEKVKDLEQAKSKSNDPNLSEEERRKWGAKVIIIEEEINRIRKILQEKGNELKKLAEEKKKNNNTISSVGSGSYDTDRHWIWDLLTIENALILGGCYLLYRLTKEEKER